MIRLMMYKIFENSTKLETMVTQIDKKKLARSLFIFTTIYTMSRVVKQHEQRINDLETELKEMKSKGE